MSSICFNDRPQDADRIDFAHCYFFDPTVPGGGLIKVRGGANLTGLRRVMNAFLGVSGSISRRYTFWVHHAGMFGVKHRCTIPMKIQKFDMKIPNHQFL
jgi:hypothetical protein